MRTCPAKLRGLCQALWETCSRKEKTLPCSRAQKEYCRRRAKQMKTFYCRYSLNTWTVGISLVAAMILLLGLSLGLWLASGGDKGGVARVLICTGLFMSIGVYLLLLYEYAQSNRTLRLEVGSARLGPVSRGCDKVADELKLQPPLLHRIAFRMEKGFPQSLCCAKALPADMRRASLPGRPRPSPAQ